MHCASVSHVEWAIVIVVRTTGTAEVPNDGSTRSWSIQEENDWLRAVLRLAEAHIKHEKEELKSLNVVFERNKQDSDQRYMALEARMRATDKDKQECELRLYREREQIRVLEAALNDVQSLLTYPGDGAEGVRGRAPHPAPCAGTGRRCRDGGTTPALTPNCRVRDARVNP